MSVRELVSRFMIYVLWPQLRKGGCIGDSIGFRFRV